MTNKIHIAGQSFSLKKSDRNSEIIDSLRKGEYPGLVEIDIAHGTAVINLSKNADFALTSTPQTGLAA